MEKAITNMTVSYLGRFIQFSLSEFDSTSKLLEKLQSGHSELAGNWLWAKVYSRSIIVTNWNKIILFVEYKPYEVLQIRRI